MADNKGTTSLSDYRMDYSAAEVSDVKLAVGGDFKAEKIGVLGGGSPED